MTEPPNSQPSVTLLCPACARPARAEGLRATCPGCAARIALRDDSSFPARAPLGRCAVCGSEALHIAKDFNRGLGVAVVLLGCIAFYWGALAGIATLIALTFADRIVYRLRPEVTVCYACKSVYRGLPLNPAHHAYELTYDETFEGTGDAVRFEPGTAADQRP